MKYGIRKFKTWMGLEGPGYSFDLMQLEPTKLYLAEILQEGHGGETRIWFQYEQSRKRLEEYCASLPHEACPISGEMRPVDIDWFLAKLADEYELNKKLKRICKKETLFRIPGDPDDGSYRSIKARFDDRVKAHLIKLHGPNVEIVNEKLEICA